MGLFEQFPYTNFHGVNLAWILEKIRDHETRITSLEERMDTAEADIDALEGRMDTAEEDIDALETQMPKSVAGDAGKVLTATGAGTATWQDVPKELPELGDAYQVLAVNPAGTEVEWTGRAIYIDFDADNVPDAAEYLAAAQAGVPIYLRYISNSYDFVAPMVRYRHGTTHKSLTFADPDGILSEVLELTSDPAEGYWEIWLRNDSDVLTWYAGKHV